MMWGRLSLQLVRFVRRERGSQLVELAIVLPVMLVLFGAIAEFGCFFNTYSTLDKATRSGARYLVSRPYNATEKAKAASLTVYGNADAGCTGTPVLSGLTCANVSITSAGGAPGYPDRVSVQIINYRYQPLFDLGKLTGKTFSLAVNVSPSTTMHYLLF
ncbi:MAG: TadE/TadG family type IV pilus assembly protein [Pyrinomonadaceae bacterium]